MRKDITLNTPICATTRTPASVGSLTTPFRPLGITHAVIRLGGGRRIEVRRGFIDGGEHIGLGDYQDDALTSGILVPRHGLEAMTEAFADVTRFLGLNPAPIPGQKTLF